MARQVISLIMLWLAAADGVAAQPEILPSMAAQECQTLLPGVPQRVSLATGAAQRWCLDMRAGELRFFQAEVSQGQGLLRISDGDGSLLRKLELLETEAFAVHAASDGPLFMRLKGPVELQLRQLDQSSMLAESAVPAASEVPENERLRLLQADLAEGRDTALEAFWREIEAHGGPLLEPLSDGRVRVTLLWRDRLGLGEARLLWPAPGINTRRLRRLADSELHYLSLELPAASRVSYQIAAPLPALDGLPRQLLRQAMHAAAGPDPLNLRRWPAGTVGARQDVHSLLELPGAVEQPWHAGRAEVGKGRLERLWFDSQGLGNRRRLSLYTPSDYAPERDEGYPLLILFDEQAYRDRVPTATILDNLISRGEIPPLVAVLVGNSSRQGRMSELPCNDAFAAMLVHELLPWLGQRYHLSRRPAQRVLAGSSFGGLAAACTAYRYPQVFGKVLSQSGSFWWGPEPGQEQWLIDALASSERLPVQFYLDAGLLEEAGANGILGSNRRLAQVLRDKGYVLHYQEFAGGHDYAVWSGTLADGLRALLGRTGY